MEHLRKEETVDCGVTFYSCTHNEDGRRGLLAVDLEAEDFVRKQTCAKEKRYGPYMFVEANAGTVEERNLNYGKLDALIGQVSPYVRGRGVAHFTCSEANDGGDEREI